MIGGLNFTLFLIASCAVAAIYIFGIFKITSDLRGDDIEINNNQ